MPNLVPLPHKERDGTGVRILHRLPYSTFGVLSGPGQRPVLDPCQQRGADTEAATCDDQRREAETGGGLGRGRSHVRGRRRNLPGAAAPRERWRRFRLFRSDRGSRAEGASDRGLRVNLGHHLFQRLASICIGCGSDVSQACPKRRARRHRREHRSNHPVETARTWALDRAVAGAIGSTGPSPPDRGVQHRPPSSLPAGYGREERAVLCLLLCVPDCQSKVRPAHVRLERSSVCSMMMLGFAASQSLIFASRVPNCACLLPDFTENIFSFTAHPSLGEAQTIRERRPCSAHNAGSGYPLCRICARPAQCERGAMIRESRVESPQA